MSRLHRRFVVGRLLALSALALHLACVRSSSRYLGQIRSSLEALPGVRVLDVLGNDDEWPFGPTDAQATLTVRGAGPLVLCGLTPESFTGTKSFRLACIGGWVPYVLGPRDLHRVQYVAGCADSVAVGPASTFSGLFPFRLGTVADVVSHYHELAAALDTWPRHNTQLRTGDGLLITYSKYPCPSGRH